MAISLTDVSIDVANSVWNVTGGLPPAIIDAIYQSLLDARTYTVDPEKVATGTGTEGDPFNMTQAMTSGVAGDVFVYLPGIYTGTPSGSRFTPSFRPTVSGTSGNNIIHIASVPAYKNTTNLTEIRSGGTVVGSGGPALGTLANDYISMYGFYTDENNANNTGVADSAPISTWTGTGVEVRFCKIVGANAPAVDNHSGLRTENIQSGLYSYNDISGFKFNSTGTGTTNQAGVMTYETSLTVFENNYIHDCADAFHIKGRDHYGNTIRYNKAKDLLLGFGRLGGMVLGPSGERNKIYQNLTVNSLFDFEIASSATVPAAVTGTDIYNNTSYTSSGNNAYFGLYFTDGSLGSGNTYQNNISVGTGRKASVGTELGGFLLGQDLVDSFAMDYNCAFGYTNFADGVTASDFNNASLTIWRSVTTGDDNSFESDPLFTDTVTDNFTLQVGSPCLTGSDVGGPVGCYITGNETIGLGV